MPVSREGVLLPIILNGITDVATRPDLLDRVLIVSLPPIPDEERRTEAELWGEFEQARPAILASLLDAVSGALRSVGDVRLEGKPRMADFTEWATAAEESLGWEPGALMAAYSGNRQEAADSALEADLVAGAVMDLMAKRDQWTGSATELWKALSELVDEGLRHTKAWPGAPNALSGTLKRLAPTLRGVGIEYREERSGHSRRKVLTKIKHAKDCHDRHHRHDGGFSAGESQMRDDGPGDGLSVGEGADRHNDDPAQQSVTRQGRIDKGNADGDDGRDGDDDDMQLFSSEKTWRSRFDNLASGQSPTLYGLSARGMGVLSAEAVAEETRRSKSGPALALGTYLENPTQERLDWLTKAVLRARGMDTVGWKAHAGAVREAVSDPASHPPDCECAECT